MVVTMMLAPINVLIVAFAATCPAMCYAGYTKNALHGLVFMTAAVITYYLSCGLMAPADTYWGFLRVYSILFSFQLLSLKFGTVLSAILRPYQRHW